MTIRLDMRRAVARAGQALGDSVDVVKAFFKQHLDQDGGFQGRDDSSDLYYTVFGLEACIALNVAVPYQRIAGYLDSFGDGRSLDLVHLAALIRCHVNLADRQGRDLSPTLREVLMGRLLGFQAGDGGFNISPGGRRGNVYSSFLALGAFQDLQVDSLDAEALIESVCSLQMPDGGFSNEETMKVSATAASAAAVAIFHYLRRPVPESTIQWLLARAAPAGGFAAIGLDPDLVVPDLLSTATALHALFLTNVSIDGIKTVNLDYLDALWSVRGGFQGHPADEVLDCEYTYYGLLSLGDLVG